MNALKHADFGNLPRCVEDVFSQAGNDTFFLLPQWFELIADCQVDGKRRTLNVAFDESAAIAMVYAKSANDIRSFTNLYTCVYDILGKDGGNGAIRRFAAEFAHEMPRGARIQLEGIDRASPSFDGLLGGFRSAGYLAKPYFAWGTWYERTAGLNFDDFVETRPSVLRHTWARKRAALEKASRSRFRIYRDGDDVGAYIAAYEDVHRRSWKDAEPCLGFIPNLVRLAADCNALRFGILDIDGVAAAAQFWIVWGGKATVYKLAYAEDMSAFSPGTVLTMEMFRHVLENDHPSEIDFGRGDDRYKKLWLTSRREHWGIEAVSPLTLRGLADAAWLVMGLGRDFLRQRLGNTKRVSVVSRRMSSVPRAQYSPE
jgi:hypothetical protein